MSQEYGVSHMPDVLTCLADLSNDEVFTPPDVANAMLDLLPEEIWSRDDVKFLDPACKTGVFLREITKRLLRGQMPDFDRRMSEIDDKRQRGEELNSREEHYVEYLQATLDHILKEQVYGIAITQMTALLTRRTLYCAKDATSEFSVVQFDNPDGNIRYVPIQHSWTGKDGTGPCSYCGASKKQIEEMTSNETHAYEFIHTHSPERLFDVKSFDVIISNPPYQLADGGSGNGISAKPIYQSFVEQAKKLDAEYLAMIIPARWYAGGKGLDQFRADMLSDKHILKLVDYPKSRDCFEGVDIAGGVCYFLRSRDDQSQCEVVSVLNGEASTTTRELNEYEIFIRSNIGIDLIRKVKKLASDTMDKHVFKRNPFGFVSSARGDKASFEGAVELISSQGSTYVHRKQVRKNTDCIGKYKVMTGKLNPDRGGVNNAADGKMNVIPKVRIIGPNIVFTETYLLLGAFDTQEEAENCASFYRTKFVRCLIALTLSSMNISTQNFQFVPFESFDKPWTDKELYEKYELTEDEIAFIDTMIKPMNLGGKDD